jgi:hypothetical protein
MGKTKTPASKTPAAPTKEMLATTDKVLQWLRVRAREMDQRSTAQHYADTQWLIRSDMRTYNESGKR